MEEPNPSSDAEATMMANGSGQAAEDKTNVMADYEKKESAGKNDELEGIAMTNGSGPPPQEKSVVPNSGEKGNEGKSDEEEKDGEEKHGEENGTAKAKDIEESKEDEKTEDASAAKAEDVKMVDAENVKDEEEGGKEGEQEIGEEGAEKEENDMEEGENGSTEKKVDEDKEAEVFKKKRSRGQKAMKKGEGKEGATKAKDLLSSPMTPSIERPVRERKTVERLVEVIEKETSREFQVEKGRGTPLKDIPNVAYKLAKKKPADIKLVHQTLFGRKGKAVNFKNHILQFSGFVWHESDEKQRAKMKEKLDKYVKDTLLDLCDLFDLPVSKANTRKEDLVAKLLDFLVAPHPTTEVIISEKDKLTKSRKRKRVAKGSALKSMEDTHTKRSRKKWTKNEASLSEEEKSVQETDNEDDDEDYNKSGPYKGKVAKHSESEGKENESEEASEQDEHDKEDLGKGKQDKKKASKPQSSVGKEKKVGTSFKKGQIPAASKSPTKSPSSKHSKVEDDDVGAKVFSRKKKIVDSPKKKSTPRSEKQEKDNGKKAAKSKAKSEAEQPSKEELRNKICDILKEVDFNTATFTDILKQLATHYKVDLTPRKASIKKLIQDELTKLADAEEDEDDEDEEDAEKEENAEPAGQEVEA